MSAGGHISEMISRMRYFYAEQKIRRKKYNKIKKAYAVHLKNKQIEIQHCTSAEELMSIKKKIRDDIRKEFRKSILTSMMIALIIFSILLYFTLGHLFGFNSF